MKNIKLTDNKDALVFDYGMSEECFELDELECVFRRGNDIFFISEVQGNTTLMPTTNTTIVRNYFKEICEVLKSTEKFKMCDEDTVYNSEKLVDFSVANKAKRLTLCLNTVNVTCSFDSIENLNSAINDVEMVLGNNLDNSI